jgi:hypothetical protein
MKKKQSHNIEIFNSKHVQFQRRFIFQTNKLNAESSPSDDNSCSVRQQISRLLWKRNVHYRVHGSLPLASVLSLINRINNKLSRCLSSTPRSTNYTLFFGFLHKNSVCNFALCAKCATCSTHLILRIFSTIIIFGGE